MRALAVMCRPLGDRVDRRLHRRRVLRGDRGRVVFGLAVILFGLGECFQGPVQGALVADLAPPRLRGRYMAVSTISWDIGFIVGPAIGGFILAAEPLALWPLAAIACLLRARALAGEPPAPAPPHARVSWVSVTGRDAQLEALDFGGTGPGVLLLHGLAGTAREWEETAAWLTETHRVVGLDQRGHGRSERRPRPEVSAEARSSATLSRQLESSRGRRPRPRSDNRLAGNTLPLARETADLVSALVVVEATPAREGPTCRADRRLLRIMAGRSHLATAAAFFGGESLRARAWARNLGMSRTASPGRSTPDVLVAAMEEA